MKEIEFMRSSTEARINNNLKIYPLSSLPVTVRYNLDIDLFSDVYEGEANNGYKIAEALSV